MQQVFLCFELKHMSDSCRFTKKVFFFNDLFLKTQQNTRQIYNEIVLEHTTPDRGAWCFQPAPKSMPGKSIVRRSTSDLWARV